MAITVKFGGVEIGNVTSVTPADSFSEDAIIDVANLVGSRSRTIAVSGFVKKAGLDKTALLAEQNAFTETLASKGPSTIEYCVRSRPIGHRPSLEPSGDCIMTR